MFSLLAVTTLSFITLYLGTYVAERIEDRRCAACGQACDQPGDRQSSK